MKKSLFLFLCAVGMSGCANQQIGPQQLPSIANSIPQFTDSSSVHGFKHLATFNLSNGALPEAGLTVVGSDLYGTTFLGGDTSCGFQKPPGCGEVFKVSKSGEITNLHSFESTPDGLLPWAPLTNVHGMLYGTTWQGGNSACNASGLPPGCGTVFKISTSGDYSVLYSFKGMDDGANPSMAPLIFAKGALYGVFIGGNGGVYRISLSGKETLIYKCTGGNDVAPSSVSYIGGSFYLTVAGAVGYGYNHYGGVEKLLPSGKAKFVYTFKGSPDGAQPMGPLASIDGTIYGATHGGGSTTCSGGCGTVYSLTSSGKEHVLHEFDSKTEGVTPYTGVLAVGSALYGSAPTWIQGGGSIFKVTTSGKESTLHEFRPYDKDGTSPYGLVTLLDGALYGTTGFGGDVSQKNPYGYGTIFNVSP